jgi:hypothetical protein
MTFQPSISDILAAPAPATRAREVVRREAPARPSATAQGHLDHVGWPPHAASCPDATGTAITPSAKALQTALCDDRHTRRREILRP